MDRVQIEIAPHDRGWSVKHNGGYLGHVRTRSEALAIARSLADWIADQGKAAKIDVKEPRSWAEAPPRDGTPRRQ